MEIVITLIIFGILGSVGSQLLSNGLSVYNASDDALDTLSKLRYATERMAREFYQIQATPSGYSIAVMNANQFQFTKADGTSVDITASLPLLTMSYDSVPGVTAPLTDKVQSFNFKYYQIDGVTPATSVLDIVYIEINITLQVKGVSYPERTRVAMRAQIG